MLTIEKTFDKSHLPPDGPWMEELDRRVWTDEKTGYPCIILRHPHFGSLCGYVAVPEGHVWYGRDRIKAHAHGGVNYAGPSDEGDSEHGVCHVPEPGEPDKVWWFGFDCMHSRDLVPCDFKHEIARISPDIADDLAAKVPGGLMFFNQPERVYRNFAYVIEQCSVLAAQLKHAMDMDHAYRFYIKPSRRRTRRMRGVAIGIVNSDPDLTFTQKKFIANRLRRRVRY